MAASLLSIVEIIILLKIKPFSSSADTVVNVICEFCLMGVYGSIGVMQMVEPQIQVSLVWTCVGLVLSGNMVGFLILVRKQCLECKKERQRRKQLIELRERVSRKAETYLDSLNDTPNQQHQFRDEESKLEREAQAD